MESISQRTLVCTTMTFKFGILFRWNRDDAFLAMHDDQLEVDLSSKSGHLTFFDLRRICDELAEQNDRMASVELIRFLKEDYNGRPRYVAFLQSILDYGVYADAAQLSPSQSDEFLSSVKIVSEFIGFVIEFEIPAFAEIEGWTHDDYVAAMNLFRSDLPDSLWESLPNSEAVHKSRAVVDYKAW